MSVQKLQCLELAQYKLSDVVDFLESGGALTDKMLELAKLLQKEMDMELMLLEEWN